MGEDYRNIAKDFNITDLGQKPILILNPLPPKLIPLRKFKWL